jgi:hypothetical protein
LVLRPRFPEALHEVRCHPDMQQTSFNAVAEMKETG